MRNVLDEDDLLKLEMLHLLIILAGVCDSRLSYL